MSNQHLAHLTAAFDLDGFDVQAVPQGSNLAIAAKHRTAWVNGVPAQRKKCYYLEGSHWEMGYQLGLMAEDDISQMATRFIETMIWELIFWKPRDSTDPLDPNEQTVKTQIKAAVGDLFTDLTTRFSDLAGSAVPQEYLDEIDGIVQGCRAVNPSTKVTRERLLVLNFGIDWFLAIVYSGLRSLPGLVQAILEGAAGITPPGMCNGFSLFGDAAEGGHYFGRDFMFPTAGVFEDTACMIIYRPDDVRGELRIPFVSVTAPGLIGSISGMNEKGVAIGVEIIPAAAADPEHVGLNSLLLNRHCLEKGATAEAAKNVIVNARRGVPWMYIISDGGTDQACVAEAVYSTPDIPFTDFPPRHLLKGCLFLKSVLPGRSFLANHPTAVQENGVMVRWSGYSYDPAYLDYNKKLFKRYHKTLHPGWSDPKGYINRTYEETNCPGMFYFAPQRETRHDAVMVTNHFIIPEMRYTAMDDWLALLFGKLNDDSQWRYDALNELITNALDNAVQAGGTGVDYGKAKGILDFLNPAGPYGEYYGVNKKVIEGAQSLFDLKAKTIESHYGYYGDDWIKLRLPNYLV